MLLAEHFPLGSALLYKTGLGTQVAVGKVDRIISGQIYVSPLEDKGPTKDPASDRKEFDGTVFDPYSEDIMPVLLFPDMSIVIGKGCYLYVPSGRVHIWSA